MEKCILPPLKNAVVLGVALFLENLHTIFKKQCKKPKYKPRLLTGRSTVVQTGFLTDLLVFFISLQGTRTNAKRKAKSFVRTRKCQITRMRRRTATGNEVLEIASDASKAGKLKLIGGDHAHVYIEFAESFVKSV